MFINIGNCVPVVFVVHVTLHRGGTWTDLTTLVTFEWLNCDVYFLLDCLTRQWAPVQSPWTLKYSIISGRGINPNNRTSWTTQTAAPPSAPSTRREASDHQCVLYRYQTGHEHLFTLRTRCSPHHRGLIRLRISDRKSVNHTAEMILWSMILTNVISIIHQISYKSVQILTIIFCEHKEQLKE